MLLKSQRQAFVGYEEGSKSVKYYNAAMKNVLVLCNYQFLIPSTSSPPEELAIAPPEELAIDPGENAPPFEGEEDRGNWSVNPVIPNKRPADTSDDPMGPRKTRGIQVDYRYLNDPFPDKEEAGIVVVREEAFAVVPDDECHSLQEAKASLEWPEWESTIHAKLDQLHRMGTWRLVDKPASVIPIANKFVFTKKRDKEGRLLKYKARLVTKGCAQRPGFDYVETHSLVVRLETI